MLSIDLKCENNPLIVANEIGFFISDRLQSESISLYSAFLLNQDALRLRRIGYRQPAWQYRLSLSGVLALHMQYLFGLAVGEATIAKNVAAWLEQDFPLLGETRNHYIRKHLATHPTLEPSEEQLIELSDIRSQYETLSDDNGPFHTEVFPYDYYSPEDNLLGRASVSVKQSKIEPDVEELMLAVSAWG